MKLKYVILSLLIFFDPMILFYFTVSEAFCFENPQFHYWIEIDETGYQMRTEMTFSSDVNLSQIISNLTQPQLFNEFDSKIRSINIQNSTQTQEGRQYDTLLTLNLFGYPIHLLSHCSEIFSENQNQWQRFCKLVPSALDATYLMHYKSESMRCFNSKLSNSVQCNHLIQGKLKNILWMGTLNLTVKAKAQALANWGRFWFYTNSGSVSTKYSNTIFERSQLNQNIQYFLNNSLSKINQNKIIIIKEKGKN